MATDEAEDELLRDVAPEPALETHIESEAPKTHSALPSHKPAKPAHEAPAPKREERQETLQFEPVTRGRFEKSEPTIVDGQDLDVPTWLRRNVRVK